MLAAMLLHVVKAPAPIHPAIHLVRPQRRLQDMRDALALILHLNQSHSADSSSIVRLPARSGIESGPVQIDPASVLGSPGDVRAKLPEVGVSIVKSFGHPISLTRKLGRAILPAAAFPGGSWR